MKGGVDLVEVIIETVGPMRGGAVSNKSSISMDVYTA